MTKENKDIDDLGQQVKVVYEEDIPKMVKVLSNGVWLEQVPPLFIELLSSSKRRTIETIKYAPNIYFQLKQEFQIDKQIIKSTIRSFEHHNKIDEIITGAIPLIRRTDFTIEERNIDIEDYYKRNYIKHYANLIVDNIATTYYAFDNNHNMTYSEIFSSSEDSFYLTEEENNIINNLVNDKLRGKYKLKITSKDSDSILQLQKVK